MIEQENRFSIAGIVDRPGTDLDGDIWGYPVLGSDDDVPELRQQFKHALLTVEQVDSAAIRIKIFGSTLYCVGKPLMTDRGFPFTGKGKACEAFSDGEKNVTFAPVIVKEVVAFLLLKPRFFFPIFYGVWD